MSINPAAPAVEASTTNREITGQAGAVLIRQVIRAIGLLEAIGRHFILRNGAAA